MTLIDGKCSDRGKQQVFNLATGKWEFVELLPQLDNFKDVKGYEVTFGGVTMQEAAGAMTLQFNQFHGWSSGDLQVDNIRTVFNMSSDE